MVYYMGSHMSLKSVLLAIAFVATLMCTLKRFFSHMYFRMAPEVGLTYKPFLTFWTLERLIVRLN